MLLVLPFCQKDKPNAERLSRWILELGGVKNHECLLVHDVGTDTGGILAPLQEAFKEVTLNIVANVPVADWSAGKGDASACNEMWVSTAWFIYYKYKKHWLWCEPDCTPTRSTWMDEIDADHVASGMPFSGPRVNVSDGSFRLGGNAVYPKNVCDFTTNALMTSTVPWDVAGASEIAKHSNFTELFQHVPSPPGQAPKFPDAASLGMIHPRTALFHPCKEGSLIDRLREKRRSATTFEVSSPIPTISESSAPMVRVPIKSTREAVLEGMLSEMQQRFDRLEREMIDLKLPKSNAGDTISKFEELKSREPKEIRGRSIAVIGDDSKSFPKNKRKKRKPFTKGHKEKLRLAAKARYAKP